MNFENFNGGEDSNNNEQLPTEVRMAEILKAEKEELRGRLQKEGFSEEEIKEKVATHVRVRMAGWQEGAVKEQEEALSGDEELFKAIEEREKKQKEDIN